MSELAVQLDHMKRALIFLFSFFVFFLPAGAAPEDPCNIAVGVPYELQPRPNYQHCTDAGDAKQLTDGAYTKGYFWTQKGTVGWRNHKPVFITLDLGKVQAISGVSFNTAAGVAGVQWPLAAYVFVADEKDVFYRVGELVSLSAAHGSPPAEGYAVHRYYTSDMKTHGRWVRLAISGQPYIFVDEIEVYSGDHAWLDKLHTGKPIRGLKNWMAEFAVREAVRRRLRRDIDALRECAASKKIATASIEAGGVSLDRVHKQLSDISLGHDQDFAAVLPVNALHRKIFRLQAKLWRTTGREDLVCWKSPHWDPLDHIAFPGTSPASVEVHLMRNEYRSAAVNFSNCADRDLKLSLSFEGLPGGSIPGWITIHEVTWTDTNSGRPIACALPEAGRTEKGWPIAAEAGLTRQVWFTLHPESVDAGEYSGRLSVAWTSEDDMEKKREIPFRVIVYPLDFPEKPAIHFGGWDYVDGKAQRGVGPGNRAALIELMRAHFADSPWASAAVMPHGGFDRKGSLTKAPDVERFDSWIGRWRGAARYCVFLSVGGRIGGIAISDERFESAVRCWAAFWADHIRSKGLEPEDFFLLLVDEPHRAEQDRTVLAWARAIHASEKGFNVWEDPTWRDIQEANREMLRACDVLCPNRPIFLSSSDAAQNLYRSIQERGCGLEFYSCSGPSTLLDPCSYYRMQFWTCWKEQAEASYFWAFSDNANGASSWNEYAMSRNTYTPHFMNDTRVVTAKMLEACREGVEDFQYFVMLREAVKRHEQTQRKNGALLKKARALLADAPENVLKTCTSKNMRWHTPLDRSYPDRVRIEILKTLQALWEQTRDR